MTFGVRQRFGRYVALESRLHGLDPTAKGLLFILVIAAIFLSASWLRLGIVASYIFVLCAMSRVGFTFFLDSLRYFSWMFALSFAVNVIFPRGDRAGALSYGALNVAGIFSVRLMLMILAATLATVVTCPSEIGDSLLVLSRLKGRLGRRVAEFVAVLSIAMRFVPVMFEEAERIKAAQMLRGQTTSGLRQRVKSVVGLIVPLLESSLRRATNLGYALEARCFGYRVPKSPGLRLGSVEVIFVGSGLALVLALAVVR
jgi:energy-coupling factor transport system permease protein